MREQSYKDAIKANDPEALVAIIFINENKQGWHKEKSVLLRMQNIFRQQKIYYM